MGREQEELAILVTARDAASRVLKGVKGQVGALERAASKGARAIGSNIERAAVAGAVGVVALGGAAVKMAIDWETAFAGVQKTVEDTPENIAAIGAEIRKMATEIPVAATELAGIAETAGALGITGKDNILGFTKVVALLGVTTDLTTEAASTSLGHLGTTLGLTGTDFEHFGNTLVDLGNKGASTESQILGMAEGVAGVASIVNLSKDEVLGWGAAFANTGEEVEAGSTELQKFFLETFGMVNKGGKDLKLLASIAGTSAKDFAAAYKKDASGTLEKFLVQLGKLSKAEQAATLESLGFTDIRITRGLLKILANTDNLTDSLDTASDAWETNNAMTKEAEKRFKTTASGLQLLRNNVTEAGITIGSELLPVINELAKEGVAWLQGHPGEVKTAAQEIGKGFKDAVTWAKSLDWEAIANALKAGGSFAQTLVGAFMAAPPWLQEFLAVGFVANKFSGGAVGDIVGALGKGLIKGILSMNAGIVNINAGVVNGGGGPGGGSRPGFNPVGFTRENFVSQLVKGVLGGLAVGAGGAFLDQAVQEGPSSVGVAEGIAGGALTIGGAGVIGSAIGLGPLGVAIGSALAVYQTQQGVSAQSSAQAAGVGATLNESLAQGSSLADLTTKLDALNTGIRGIESNPLNVLIAGDALEQLKGMRSQVEAQLALQQTNVGLSLEERDARNATLSAAQKAGDESTAAVERLRSASAQDLGNVKNATDRVYGAVESMKGAIHAISIPPPSVFVTVNTSVSIRDTQSRTRSASSYGSMIGGK
jgi:TP901 family phage tail tape measure protein